MIWITAAVAGGVSIVLIVGGIKVVLWSFETVATVERRGEPSTPARKISRRRERKAVSA